MVVLLRNSRKIRIKQCISASGSLIAAAAAASHGAVSSAITQVAVTAVAIASGACLSTKLDFFLNLLLLHLQKQLLLMASMLLDSPFLIT